MTTVPDFVERTDMGQALLFLFANFFQLRCILPCDKSKFG